jgi:PAS domain-containing protein
VSIAPGFRSLDVDHNARVFKILRIYCQVSVIAVLALAGLVLYGWAFHINALMTVFPGLVTMKANTAVGLAFAAISVWLLLPGESRHLRGHIARLLALAVVLIGAITLCEYVFALDFGIDRLLVKDPNGSLGTSAPGRLAPMTGTAFITLGLALILLDWKTQRGRYPAQLLSLWTGLIAMMAFCGYIYHATALYRLLLYAQVAVHTAVALFLLSGAVLFARPRCGIARDLTGEGSGSVMARRLLPAIFFVPILLGWIRLQGQLAGLYGTELGIALYATATIFVFAVLVWISALKMNVEYRQRSAAKSGIRVLNAELEERVTERTKALEQQALVLTEQAVLLDLAHEVIFVRDAQNRILSWNRGAEIAGQSLQQILFLLRKTVA